MNTPDTDSTKAPVDAGVAGERRDALVHRPRTLDARVQRVLAIGVTLAVGVAFLTWYYTRLAAAQPVPAAAPRDAQALGADSVLPTLVLPPRVERPVTDGVSESGGAVGVSTGADGDPRHIQEEDADDPGPDPYAPALGEDESSNPGPAYPDVPRRHSTAVAPAVSTMPVGTVSPGGAPGVSERPAPVLIRPSAESAASIALPGAGASTGARGARVGTEGAPGALAESLVPTVTAGASATLGPDRTFWLPKGAFLDCTLETAIDSTLPGFATCVTAADTWGADGRAVLLPRGTKLVGEVGASVRLGAARVAVLWIEARTPSGVLVPLASPGTDAEGRAGVPGRVDTHFDERFGAAILLSLLDAGTQALAASQQQAGTVVVSPDGSRQVVAEILKDTIGIPPTVTVPRGARVQVLVARDVDFSSVYGLRARG